MIAKNIKMLQEWCSVYQTRKIVIISYRVYERLESEGNDTLGGEDVVRNLGPTAKEVRP